MYSCTKILICLTVTCSLDKISKVFHAGLVNIDLWWVVVYIAGAGDLTIINANVFTRSWEADDHGEWWRMGGGIFKPQDTRLLEDRCRGWQEKKTNYPLNASLKWNNCMHGTCRIPFLGKKTMLSARIPVSRENCVNFSFRSSLASGVRAETQNWLVWSRNLRVVIKAFRRKTDKSFVTNIDWLMNWAMTLPGQGHSSFFFIFLFFFLTQVFARTLTS